MDNRQMIVDQLREANRHVELGEKHIARQYDIISELERNGEDSDADRARELLATLKEMQKEYVAHRNLLEHELATPLSSFL